MTSPNDGDGDDDPRHGLPTKNEIKSQVEEVELAKRREYEGELEEPPDRRPDDD